MCIKRSYLVLFFILYFSFIFVACAKINNTNTEEQSDISPEEIGIEAVECKIEPLIDGKLNDEAWLSAPRYGCFTKLGTKEPASVKTEFSVLHDKENLYLGVECFQPMNELVRRSKGHDNSAVFSDDSVEIFLNSLATVKDAQSVNYFQIAVSASGAWVDISKEKGDMGTILDDISWNPNLKVKTVSETDRWTAEIAIPFSQLTFSEAHPRFFSINVGRNWQGTKPTEWSTWSVFSKKNFNTPEEFQRLKVLNVDFSPYLWEITNPRLSTVGKISSALSVLVEFDLTNKTGQNTAIKMTTRLSARNGVAVDQSKEVSCANGTSIHLKVPISVQAEGNYDLELFTSTPDEKKDILYFAKGKNKIFYSLLDVAITTPCYRDNIYSDQDIKTIEGVITANIDTTQYEENKINIELSDAMGLKLFQNSIDISEKAIPFIVPAAKLKDGTYTLSINLIKKVDESILGNVKKIIRKLPYLKGEARYDKERNCMLVDGKPLMPIGWYGGGNSEDEFSKMLKTNFNFLYNGVSLWLGEKGTKAYLDECQKNGLKFMTLIYPDSKIMKTLKDADKAPEEVRNAIATFVASVKNHPSLFGWYIADEPEYNKLKPSCLEDLYQLVREIDPYHPVVMLNCTNPGINDYKNAADILMPDIYPSFFKEEFDTKVSIEKIAELLYPARKAIAGRGPVWITPEAFNYATEFVFRDRRFPTFAEERAMTVLAIIHGVSGFCYFSYNRHLNSPDLFVAMPYIAEELKKLSPIILEGETIPALSSVKNVHVLCKKFKGAYYLFAVNVCGISTNATFSIPGISIATWNVISEGRDAIMSNDVITDHFDVVGTHIYTTATDFPTLKNIASIQTDINNYKKSLCKKGNIAYIQNGTTVKTSLPLETTTPDTLSSVVDGCTDPVSTGISFRKQPSAENQQWIEVSFKQKHRINSIKFYAHASVFVWSPPTPYLFDYRLSYFDGTKFVPLAENKCLSIFTEHTFDPITSDCIRLELLKTRGRADLVELEVYEAK